MGWGAEAWGWNERHSRDRHGARASSGVGFAWLRRRTTAGGRGIPVACRGIPRLSRIPLRRVTCIRAVRSMSMRVAAGWLCGRPIRRDPTRVDSPHPMDLIHPCHPSAPHRRPPHPRPPRRRRRRRSPSPPPLPPSPSLHLPRARLHQTPADVTPPLLASR